MADIGGVWRTVGGRRIFIKDGQDLSSAMKESGKFKTSKSKKNSNLSSKELRKQKENLEIQLQEAETSKEKDIIKKQISDIDDMIYDKEMNEWDNNLNTGDIRDDIKNKTDTINNKPEYKKLNENEIDDFQSSSDIAYNKMKSNTLEAINEYSMGGYQDINDFLNGKYPDYKFGNEIVKEIDSAMSYYELKDDIISFKGTSKNHYENYKIGDIINMKMYNSTALNENIAKTFLSEKKNPIMLEIKIPKGTKCLYIGDNSSYEFESELLLGRNLKYKIIDKTEEKIIMEVVK